MKKRLVAVLIVVVMCLAALSGCSVIKGLERDVQVILKNEGEYVGTYTVNQFNNAVVPEMEKENYQFRGWSPLEDWTEEDGEEYLSESTGLIRYDDVKDFVDGENLSITLYAAYAPVPERDLVIAWYAKSTTSGIYEEHMTAFQDNLYTYLETQGYTPESMDIVIRGYSGDVGTTCSEIRKDGDVDIMVGWSSTSNITGTGGMVEGVDFIENNGGITIGEKERYAARLTDKELVNLVYRWIFDEYGEPLPEPVPEADLVIAWYDKESTSGLNQAVMDTFKTELESYLSTQGYTPASMQIVIQGFDGDVATSCGNIKAVGNVDIMVGWSSSSNLNEKAGWVEGVDFIMNADGVTIGTKTRYAALLDNNELSNLVYTWIFATYAESIPEIPEPGTDPEPTPDPDTQTQLTVGWYAKSGTSGLDQTIISVFTRGLNAYLAANNYSDVEVIVRAYDGKVDEVQTAVTTDGDVDVMIGMKAFSVEGIIEQQDDVPMGEKTDRRVHLLDEGEVSKAIYEWLKTDDARALLLTPAAQTQLVIGWYAKSGTSGLDQTIIDTFTAGLNAYLETQGYTSANLTVVFRAYDGKVDEVISAVDTDGDVDIMVGMKAFDYEGVLEVQEDVPMGEKTDRRVHLLDDDAVSLLVFDWLKTDEARALFAATATTALAA